MNTHKIIINSKINEILAVDSNDINSEIITRKSIEILLKKNTNMKNKLLKIRNEMNKNEKDIESLLEQKLANAKTSQGYRNKIFKNKNIYMNWNKLCKSSKFKESDHHRSLITYDDLDSDYYSSYNEDNLCLNNNKNSNNKFLKDDKLKDKTNTCGMNDEPCKCKRIDELIEIKLQFFDESGNKLPIVNRMAKNESPTLRMFNYKDKDKETLPTKTKKITSLKKMKQSNDIDLDDLEKKKNLISQMCLLMPLLFKQFESTSNIVSMLENQTGSLANTTHNIAKNMASLAKIVAENLNRK